MAHKVLNSKASWCVFSTCCTKL